MPADRFVDVAELEEALVSADHVLLGESHENLDHHRLQAWMLERVVASGRKPVLAMEMLDRGQEAEITAYLTAGSVDGSGFGHAVAWSRRGWPAYAMYAPIVRAALRHGLDIVPANVARSDLDDLRLHTVGAVNTGVLKRLGIESALDVSVRTAMEEELIEAHCGYAPAHYLQTMVAIQRARDVAMARTLAAHPETVLIAGVGHVRTDRGVPWHLGSMAPGSHTVSVALLEVTAGAERAEQYAARFRAESLPFDYVWFTPSQSRGDPCDRFRDDLERKLRRRSPQPKPSGPAEPPVRLSGLSERAPA